MTNTIPVGRPTPIEDDVDTAGFWAATRKGELRVLSCTTCGADIHVPRAVCPVCGGQQLQWRSVAGRGTLFSWIVVERQVHPAFETPYTVVLVALDDAPTVRLVGSLPGSHQLQTGIAMEVRFEKLESGAVLPQWVPEDKAYQDE